MARADPGVKKPVPKSAETRQERNERVEKNQGRLHSVYVQVSGKSEGMWRQKVRVAVKKPQQEVGDNEAKSQEN